MDIPISQDSPRPSAVGEWLLIMAMMAVVWLPQILLGLALLGLTAVFGDWAMAAPPLIWALLGFLSAVGSRDHLPGRALQPSDEPELTALVADVAEQLGFRAPLLLRVVPEPDAALGPAKVPGARSYVLLLGLPLLRAMTAAQLAAVVAHELAHEQHVCDRRTAWLLRARSGLAERLEAIPVI